MVSLQSHFSVFKRKDKKRHAVIYYRLLHASRNIKNPLLFSLLARKRYLRHNDWQSCWFFKMNGLLHTKKCLRFRVGKIAPCREGTYDFTNDLTGMHLPAPLLPNNTWKTFRYARWCSLVLLDEKRKHSGRISLDLPSLYPCSSLFSSMSISSQRLLFRTSWNGTRILF